MDEFINKETRIFLLVFAGVMLFLYFIFPKINDGLIIADFSSLVGPILGVNNQVTPSTTGNTPSTSPNNIQIDTNRDYKVIVKTTKGEFTIDLYEQNAPKNVANFVSLSKSYADGVFDVDKDYLIRVRSNANISYTVEDEINADYLLLNNIKVKDAPYLRSIYDKNDPSTRVFEPNNLRKYEDFSLKQFYSEVLGYKYSKSLATTKAVKYTVYMTNTGPNTNKADFFILMASSAPEIDGRYTPIGRVVGGFTTLDSINNSQERVKITSVTIQ